MLDNDLPISSKRSFIKSLFPSTSARFLQFLVVSGHHMAVQVEMKEVTINLED